MIKRLPLLLLFFFPKLQAQYFDYSASAVLQGIYSSEEYSPFWMHTNQRGRIDELTTMAGWVNLSGSYIITEDASIEMGIGALYQDGFSDEIQLDEYYLSFENQWLHVFAGRKQRPELYKGLSATNENILWSLNARPLSGVGINIPEPVFFWPEAGLGFKATWEEFVTDDVRYVENTRIHHKSFHLVFNKIRNIQLTFGVQHFVQWGGTSPEYGDLPSGFDDYLRVVTGSGIGGEADGSIGEQEINGLGNHLGSYEIYLNTSVSGYDVELIYNTLFEDKSGMMLRNTPDGRYGIYVEDQRQGGWLDAVMYEYYYTRNQSKNTPTSDGKDNYFNNNLYRSGWTYENRILGLPFILLDEDRFRVSHNNIVAHHLGLTGTAFQNYPYKLLTSYRLNYGAKAGTSTPSEKIWSSYLDVKVWQQLVDINIQVGADVSSETASNLGAGIRLSKNFF